jgi:hypothetical protein
VACKYKPARTCRAVGGCGEYVLERRGVLGVRNI